MIARQQPPRNFTKVSFSRLFLLESVNSISSVLKNRRSWIFDNDRCTHLNQFTNMIFARVIFLASFLVPALAGKFSVPITKTERSIPRIISSFSDQHARAQKPISSSSKLSSQAPFNSFPQSHGSPIEVSSPLSATSSNISSHEIFSSTQQTSPSAPHHSHSAQSST